MPSLGILKQVYVTVYNWSEVKVHCDLLHKFLGGNVEHIHWLCEDFTQTLDDSK